MPLTALGIKKAGDGRLGDGKGLSLYKKGDRGKWIWRYHFAGKRREMGLGTWPTVSLADVRLERDRWALALSQGRDPISERSAAKAATLEAMTRRDPPLEQLAREFFETYKRGLRTGGASARWMSALENTSFQRSAASRFQPFIRRTSRMR